MSDKAQITLQFPMAGLDEAGPYRQQPPFGTVSALNVRPPDVYEARRRGGSRPGLSTVDVDETILAPSGNPTVDVNSVTYMDEDVEGNDIRVTEVVRIRSSEHRYVTSVEWAQKLYIAVPENMKVYDPLAEGNKVTDWEAEIDPDTSPEDTKGEVPEDCFLIARYRDRIFLAGDPPHMWYASRTANPLDWDYGQEDPGRAVAGMNSEAGTVGEPITAMFAYGDSYLVFGCANALWRMRGDPAFGGRIDNISRTVGIVGPHAWTYGPAGELYFLSANGLMMLPPGLDGIPQPISQMRLPKQLKGIDPSTNRFVLAYDTLAHGLHIFVTNDIDSDDDVAFWYDFGGESFWPVQNRTINNERPISRGFVDSEEEGRKAIFGTVGGPVVAYDSGILDDAEDPNPRLASHVTYGPVMLGGSDYRDGMVSELIGVLADDSNSVRWKIFVGDSAEEAAKKAIANSGEFASGTWSSGLNYKSRVRARGKAFCLRVESRFNRSWALENIHAVVRNLGAMRKY